ncbi:30S ribosomal protein S17 [Candidatus Falkowbacteria bacterium RIFCSPLOWO2_12_FULL_45_10]|uniref:Small ribosomal subunit protein uS17 n=3 Tax=Candidatus Falkowiibacteriota TaxID=1752728 RepID=A0A1F5RJY9_9BACT|nr:MAG: 30S ribosomal protein S17 [Candidatus Falkowbacteria bacterium RIFCSPHIGHO2_02_FULL_45_15]OGF19165.1 MAG: 30S ribosomal protein S17 [Candidatus Falkowbacteria bacterium RIFCSPLOWO2_12_FULL_45_10]OGF20174.1 MAG: 30S ribosomal protein S17 [Candidatus Falkowbacteria bacterium RIFCSPLOWO2_02_FULL_45_15]
MANKQLNKISKKFQGIVVSDKMDKTIVVKVDRVKRHPKYHKSFLVSKQYKVHDERNQFKDGDQVVFVECRPLSKDKRWRVLYEVSSQK